LKTISGSALNARRYNKMGTYDTIGGTPRNDPAFDVCIDTEGICPVCGEQITLLDRETTDGRLIGSCKDAFTYEAWMK
jgi:hypothetical protein